VLSLAIRQRSFPARARGKVRRIHSRQRFAGLVLLLWICAPAVGFSQTPSPLQEWQYSSGVILQRLFDPGVREWQAVVGLATEVAPLYDGAHPYRVEAGPVINVRYRDSVFFSVGEGVGMNVVSGEHYRAGIALGYDLGRRDSDYSTHLQGLGDIGRAPVIKLFASYAVSKQFPLVLRVDVRQFVGGADGAIGDFGAYLPLPGSSKKLIMFAGPSITLADHLYMQKEFGVNAAQAAASAYPEFVAHGGANAVGFGFSATRFITDRWLINVDAAVDRLLGSANASPITQVSAQHVLAVSFAYKW
jgi:outer membrane scaffolding protein for murein synthesis (MipA/OmpV family)